jgi:chromosome segregation ATPase
MAANDDAKELKGILGEVKAAMKEAEESSKRMANGFKSTQDSLSSLVGLASTFNAHQNQTKQLSSDQLKILSEKLQKEKENLKLSQESLEKQIQKNQQQKAANEQKIAELSLNSKVKNLSKEQQNQLEKLKKSNKDLKQTIQDQAIAYEQANDVLNDIDGSIGNLEKGLDKAVKKAKGLEMLGKVGKIFR